MELIIIIVCIISMIIVYYLMHANFKELKKIAENKELNEIAKKLPDNKQICKSILKILQNEHTKIKENADSDATLYIAIQDKISIGNTHESFTRIQTMVHECLHSIQDKKMLIFNFIYSNIYLLYFIIICVLTILNKLQNEMIYLNILLIFSFVYYVIRIFLENDAMIKAEFIAEDYMEKESQITKQEIDKLKDGFKKINEGCIKGTNCSLFEKIMIKVIIFNVLALIF